MKSKNNRLLKLAKITGFAAVLSVSLSIYAQSGYTVQKFSNIQSQSDANVSLEQIERSEFSTRIQVAMRVNKEGESYCLWDVGDKHAFVLEDADTGKIFPLQAQNSQLGSCNKDTWIWMLPDDPVEAQLFFPPLPKTVERVKLYEVSANDNSNPAVFDAIELVPMTDNLAEKQSDKTVK